MTQSRHKSKISWICKIFSNRSFKTIAKFWKQSKKRSQRSWIKTFKTTFHLTMIKSMYRALVMKAWELSQLKLYLKINKLVKIKTWLFLLIPARQDPKSQFNSRLSSKRILILAVVMNRILWCNRSLLFQLRLVPSH